MDVYNNSFDGSEWFDSYPEEDVYTVSIEKKEILLINMKNEEMITLHIRKIVLMLKKNEEKKHIKKMYVHIVYLIFLIGHYGGHLLYFYIWNFLLFGYYGGYLFNFFPFGNFFWFQKYFQKLQTHSK